MDNVKKGYETRIQQDLLTDAILGKNRIKLYQQHFQVSLVLEKGYCDRSIYSYRLANISVPVMLAGLYPEKNVTDQEAKAMVVLDVYDIYV